MASAPWEIDHVFVFVAPGGAEAALLTGAGLREGARRTHAGQGTSNVCFPLGNAYLELIWASDEREIRSDLVGPLRLWERSRWRETGASSFGICLRPSAAAAAPPPFETFSYRPPYLPPGAEIRVAESAEDFTEPLIFALPNVRQTDRESDGLRLNGVRLEMPNDRGFSSALTALSDCGLVALVPGASRRMELALGAAVKDFQPDLPLKIA